MDQIGHRPRKLDMRDARHQNHIKRAFPHNGVSDRNVAALGPPSLRSHHSPSFELLPASGKSVHPPSQGFIAPPAARVSARGPPDAPSRGRADSLMDGRVATVLSDRRGPSLLGPARGSSQNAGSLRPSSGRPAGGRSRRVACSTRVGPSGRRRQPWRGAGVSGATRVWSAASRVSSLP